MFSPTPRPPTGAPVRSAPGARTAATVPRHHDMRGDDAPRNVGGRRGVRGAADIHVTTDIPDVVHVLLLVEANATDGGLRGAEVRVHGATHDPHPGTAGETAATVDATVLRAATEVAAVPSLATLDVPPAVHRLDTVSAPPPPRHALAGVVIAAGTAATCYASGSSWLHTTLTALPPPHVTSNSGSILPTSTSTRTLFATALLCVHGKKHPTKETLWKFATHCQHGGGRTAPKRWTAVRRKHNFGEMISFMTDTSMRRLPLTTLPSTHALRRWQHPQTCQRTRPLCCHGLGFWTAVPHTTSRTRAT